MTDRAAIVLGIETSCDETAAALVDGDGRVLAERIASQDEEHRAYGGVVPEIAARAHVERLDHLIAATLAEADVGFADLAAVAATAGPGLIGGVMVGLVTGKAIAAVHRRPLVAVNHLEGHALSIRLAEAVPFPYLLLLVTGKAIAAVHRRPLVAVNHLEGHALSIRLAEAVPFPYLLLLVSGGHCQLLAVEGVGRYRRYGTTLDDAAGEAFDKAAKLLGLGFPGGPAVERAAREGDGARFALPRPLEGRPGADFSFSGLKTALAHRVAALAEPTPRDIADLAAAFQAAVVAVLADRTANAARAFVTDYGTGALVVAGGVAANGAVRAALQVVARPHGLRFAAPPPRLCTDNAAMIAWAGVERLRLGLTDALDVPARARWPLGHDAPAPMDAPAGAR